MKLGAVNLYAFLLFFFYEKVITVREGILTRLLQFVLSKEVAFSSKENGQTMI